MPIDHVLALMWICWGAFWALAALGSGTAERVESRSSRLTHVSLVAVSFFLLFEPFRLGPFGLSILPEGPAFDFLGTSLAALGLSLAIWARLHLGRNWSGTVAIRSEQRLVQSGPYALVRHPIYAALLMAVVGTAIAIGKLGAVIALPILFFAYWRKLRIEESALVEAFGDEYESYRRRVGALLPLRTTRASIRDASARSSGLLSTTELGRTIDRLRGEGQLSEARAHLMRQELPHAISESAYVLRHLGAHLTIGVVFAFDVIPLPLGTIGRVLWVAGNRAYETGFGSRERARVHSFKVFLVAAIPWIGYVAYLLPLRNESSELAWLLAHNLSYRFYGVSFEEFLAAKPRVLRRLGGWLLPPISGETHREPRR
jgi:protein-S-isoprenylcysteine O-methyltransferase Ste14